MDSVELSDGEQGRARLNHEAGKNPRQLPPDLPTSLDDRRAPATFDPGIEVYDAWQGARAAFPSRLWPLTIDRH